MNCSVKPRASLGIRGLRFACGFAAPAAILLFAATAIAAPPKINKLSVRGFQAGGTTRLIVSGTGLGSAPKLLLDVPIAEQKPVDAKPAADTFQVDVRLDAAIAPGLYHLRVQTPDGVSPPEVIAIDSLPQRLATTADAEPRTLPVVLHGAVAAAAVQDSPFTGRKGETVTIDVLARRFGSKLRPVVHLYDAEHRQIAWSLPQSTLAGDARLTTTLPADGTYVVAVHDLTYAAAAPNYYRLTIGSFDYADAVYPPVAARGASTPLELIGRFGKFATAKLDATQSAAALADATLGVDRPLPWPAKSQPAGLRPRIQISDLPEITEEQSLAVSRKLPTAPIAVSGRLLTPDETDLYHLDLAASEKVRIDVLADRLGSPLDATLELRDAKGARLAQNDDAVGPDSRLDYTAPNKPTPVTIAVGDALRRGDPSFIYRVVVTRLGDAPPTDFRLSFVEETHNVPSDGTKVFRVSAERSGYDGPIRLSIVGLPAGFVATPVEIPASADGALVELRRTGKAVGDAVGHITIRGEAVGAKPALVRTAEGGTHPLGRLQPWLKYDAVIAATAAAAGPIVSWDDKSAKSSPLYVGTDGKLAIRVLRDPATTGIVRLSLLTSQAPPPADQAAAQAQASQLRGVAATVDVKPAKPAKDKAAQATDETAEFAVRIPQELRLAEYDVALKAELLSADGKSTVAESYTPPRRFRTQPPITLVADAAPAGPIKLDAKSGAAISLSGAIERLQGFAGDVTVTLVGLPAGVTAPSVVLKPKGDKFKLDFKLPPTFAATRLEGIKITATLAAAGRPASAVKVEADLPPRDVAKSDAKPQPTKK